MDDLDTVIHQLQAIRAEYGNLKVRIDDVELGLQLPNVRVCKIIDMGTPGHEHKSAINLDTVVALAEEQKAGYSVEKMTAEWEACDDAWKLANPLEQWLSVTKSHYDFKTDTHQKLSEADFSVVI